MAIKYINGSMYDSLQAQAVSLIQRPTTTEEMLGATPQQKFIEGADLTSTPVSPDLIKPIKDTPELSGLLDKAKEEYPYLKDKEFDYVENFTDDKDAGYLEFWQPGDPGDPEGKFVRPEGISMDKVGIEVRRKDTRPIDILGDYVSHYGVDNDKELNRLYTEFDKATPDEMLRTKYKDEQERYGEKRSYEEWKKMSGLPGLFRGYTFNQYPKSEINNIYNQEQLRILDQVRDYVGVNKVERQAMEKEEPITTETTYDRPASQDMQVYKEFLIEEEDIKTEAYKPDPNEEFYTIGVGHYGADVKEGQVITEEEALNLLEDDISKRLPAIRKAIPKFDDMPIEVKKHIVGSWFRGSLSGSPKTLRLINEGKFEEAAKEFLNNNEYRTTTLRGVKRRMEATAQAIASLSL